VLRFAASRASIALVLAAANSTERFGAVAKKIDLVQVSPLNAVWRIMLLCSPTKKATSVRRRSMESGNAGRAINA